MDVEKTGEPSHVITVESRRETKQPPRVLDCAPLLVTFRHLLFLSFLDPGNQAAWSNPCEQNVKALRGFQPTPWLPR